MIFIKEIQINILMIRNFFPENIGFLLHLHKTDYKGVFPYSIQYTGLNECLPHLLPFITPLSCCHPGIPGNFPIAIQHM